MSEVLGKRTITEADEATAAEDTASSSSHGEKEEKEETEEKSIDGRMETAEDEPLTLDSSLGQSHLLAVGRS